MANYTLTYSPSAQGWPSFYTYYPDWMVGMNSYFYTFKGGDLWRHDTNATTLTFYDTGGTASLQGVFNDAVLENKLFKTIALESEEAWTVALQTDLQNGDIESGWFEQKEAIWYAFIRAEDSDPNNYRLRSVNGIGSASSVDSTNLAAVVITFTVDVGSIISVGDSLYFGTPTPALAGTVTATTASTITVDTTAGAVPSSGDFILYLKDSVSESHGVLGRYCIFTITNSTTTDASLFAVRSEVMKSFP